MLHDFIHLKCPQKVKFFGDNELGLGAENWQRLTANEPKTIFEVDKK
jgi:hypothetical protein